MFLLTRKYYDFAKKKGWIKNGRQIEKKGNPDKEYWIVGWMAFTEVQLID